MNLKNLDNCYCDGSEWEQVLLSTDTAIVKVVYFGEELYSVLTYKLSGETWRVVHNSQHENPHTEDIVDAIGRALSVAPQFHTA